MFFIIGYKTCFLMFFYAHIDVFDNYGSNCSCTADRSNVRVQRQLTVKDDAKVTSCVDDRYAS